MKYDFIIEVNNCIDPSVIIYYVEEDRIKASKIAVSYDKDGRINDADKLAEQIKSHFNTLNKNCLIVLNLNEFFSINRFYPNLGIRKSRRLYDSSIKEEFPDLNKYKTYECEYEIDNNSLYSIYAMKLEYIEYYKNFLTKCGYKNIWYKSKGHYLIDEYINMYKVKTFALYHYENGLLYFNVCINGKLIYSITCLDKIETANNMALSCIDGLNYGLKRNVISNVITNKDIESICNHEVIVRKVGKNFSQEAEKF